MTKKKQRIPRSKRMKHESRLQFAKHWIPTYTGKNIIKGYKKHFGVDLLCAVRELKLLGVKLNDQYVTQALQSREQLIVARQKRREEKIHMLEQSLFDSDGNYYFIAGYTSGGVPYGITWEEATLEKLIQF